MPPERRTDTSVSELYADPSRMRPERRAEAIAEVIRRDRLGYAADVLLGSTRALVAEYTRPGPASLWHDAALVTAPTLVIYGSHDRLVSPALAARAARTFRYGRVRRAAEDRSRRDDGASRSGRGRDSRVPAAAYRHEPGLAGRDRRDRQPAREHRPRPRAWQPQLAPPGQQLARPGCRCSLPPSRSSGPRTQHAPFPARDLSIFPTASSAERAPDGRPPSLTLPFPTGTWCPGSWTCRSTATSEPSSRPRTPRPGRPWPGGFRRRGRPRSPRR